VTTTKYNQVVIVFGGTLNLARCNL